MKYSITMKLKFLVLCLAVALATLGSPVAVLAGNRIPVPSEVEENVPKVDAYAYVVMDADSGKVIFSKRQHKRLYPASTAKIMTALVALESKKKGVPFTATSEVLAKVDASASEAGAIAGETYSFKDMLHMLMLPSGADAATMLAYSTYGGLDEFCRQMNRKAKELGMKNSSFDNPVGLDISDGYNKTYATAKDYGIMGCYAIKNKQLRKVLARKSYKVKTAGQTLRLKSTNAFFDEYACDSEDFTILGAKTGFTDDAGRTLLAFAENENKDTIVIAFFNAETRETQFGGVRDLFEYTFEQIEKGTVVLP